MTKGTIIIERVFNADIKDVWEALTIKELMKQWYFDLPEFRAEVGFRFQFTGGEEGGKQYLHLCEILEVIPFQKLLHTWKFDGYEGISYLSFELFSMGTQTKLILTHSGIDSFPNTIPDFAIQNFEKGWTSILEASLTNYLQIKT